VNLLGLYSQVMRLNACLRTQPQTNGAVDRNSPVTDPLFSYGFSSNF
jgi:hypothetical protein